MIVICMLLMYVKLAFMDKVIYLHLQRIKYHFWIKTRDCEMPSSPSPALISFKDVPLVEFMYLVFTRVPGESYHKFLLLCLYNIFQTLINSLVVELV